uniref:Uncharacterized protein n=1 Tax=Parastrongyloides trichosuri TaxID=131310 RepID=A0A0N4ZFR5_PARTI
MSKVKKFANHIRKAKRNGEADRRGPKRGPIGKKTKKSKMRAADPFNVAARQAKLHDLNKINKPISETELDVQKVPRSIREILKAKEKIKEQKEMMKQNKDKKVISKITEVTEKLGFKKKRYEDDSQLIRRVVIETNQAVEEQAILAKYGLAGRSQKELDKDMKEYKEKQQKKKETKKMLHERRIANIKAKEEKELKEKEAAKERRRRAKFGDIETDDQKNVEMTSKEFKVKKFVKEAPKSRFEINPWEKNEKITSKQRRKMLKESDKEIREKEAKVFKKDNIKFGEVANEPPKFSVKLLRKLK